MIAQDGFNMSFFFRLNDLSWADRAIVDLAGPVNQTVFFEN